MAQSRRVRSGPAKKPRPPLDAGGLERLALNYVGRYSTTRAKLVLYLQRKLRERGWADDGEPPVERFADRLAELGYVDDAAYAAAKAESLTRRGFGTRRVADALRAAGIAEEDAGPVREQARNEAFTAALRFAERKLIGPYWREEPDRAGRHKAFAAMMRAGHSPETARRILDLRRGEIPDRDTEAL